MAMDETSVDPRSDIRITDASQLYAVQNQFGDSVDYKNTDGRTLFNHYRHNMTNYDEVLDDLREQNGRVTGYQQKLATAGAAEVILEKYRDEHVGVIQDSQRKGYILKNLMQKAGVGTASALVNFLDSCSEKIKDVARLENSQRQFQAWNDTYRVQRDLVRKILKDAAVEPEVLEQVNKVYGTRSVNKAVELGMALFDWEKSEVLKLVKGSIRYIKLKD